MKNRCCFMLILLMGLANILFASDVYSGFTSPRAGEIVRERICTLDVSIQDADSVAFSVLYRNKRHVQIKKHIGTLVTPPFKIIWSDTTVPNQYMYGISCIADVYGDGGLTQTLYSDNVYYLPALIPPSKIIPFSAQIATDVWEPLIGIGHVSGDMSATYDENFLRVRIRMTVPKSFLDTRNETDGATIILDPTNDNTPYPGNKTVILHTTYRGESRLITSIVERDTFQLGHSGTAISLNHSLKQDRSGQMLFEVEVPPFLIGGKIPDSLGINVLVDAGNGHILSLIDAPKDHQYVPLLFPTLKRTDDMSQLLSPVIVFLLTLVVGFVFACLVRIIKERVFFAKVPMDPIIVEERLQQVARFATDKHRNSAIVAKPLGISPTQLERLCVHETGMSFERYLEWCRIEIVKERLMSSNQGEAAIAKDCGFGSVAEMETLFRDFVGIAAYQYRERYRKNIV